MTSEQILRSVYTDINMRERPKVRTAKLIVLGGEVSLQDFNKVRQYCINPIEARKHLWKSRIL